MPGYHPEGGANPYVLPEQEENAKEAEVEQALLTEAAQNTGNEDVSSRKPRQPINTLCTMHLVTSLGVNARSELAYSCAGGRGPRDREQAGAADRSRSQHRQ